MKSALIAFDPMDLEGKTFENFCKTVRALQELKVFSRTSIVSVIHSSQFVMPYSYYESEKHELARDSLNRLLRACRGKFDFNNAKVLKSGTHSNEEIVELLTKHGKSVKADFLVVASHDRKGIPYWLLGSLSETASLSAKMPVLVIKNTSLKHSLIRSSNVVVGVDVAALPSSRDINWIANLTKSMHAHAHLLYVEPNEKPLLSGLQERKDSNEAIHTLKQVEHQIRMTGASVSSSIRHEEVSIPHAIVEFAEQKQALLTIVTTAKRSRIRRLLLGSTARNVLALTKRPYLSLREE